MCFGCAPVFYRHIDTVYIRSQTFPCAEQATMNRDLRYKRCEGINFQIVTNDESEKSNLLN